MTWLPTNQRRVLPDLYQEAKETPEAESQSLEGMGHQEIGRLKKQRQSVSHRELKAEWLQILATVEQLWLLSGKS